MVMASEHANARPALPIPDAQGLVVRRTHNPWLFPVELDRADVVQVPQQGEQAAAQLVVPNLDLVVVSPTAEQGLCRMEIDATDLQ